MSSAELKTTTTTKKREAGGRSRRRWLLLRTADCRASARRETKETREEKGPCEREDTLD
jgi:hypothetical protein